MHRVLSLTIVGCLLAAVPARAGLVIHLNPDAGLSANPAALAAFERAAQAWENVFTDNITVNINAGLATFANPNIIGSTSSTILSGGYDLIRNAMVADAAPNEGILAFLPTAAQFSATVPAGRSLAGTALTQANANALGFNVNFGPDAQMTFNSAFAFDYDRSDGVDADKIDFQSVAIHEIGHALGFISGVDTYDTGGRTATLTTLDLFRFPTGNVPTTNAAFRNTARDFVPGHDTSFSDTVSNYRFSTGVNLGDGRQASHWKDGDLTGTIIGVMDPTIGFGQTLDISAADIRALGLIGWDVSTNSALAVPEPTSVAMLLVGAGSLVGFARVRRKAPGV